MRDIISPWGLFNNTLPFTISLPLPLPFPLPVLSPLPISLPIFCSLPFPCPFLTSQHVLITLTIVNVIAIARTAPSTAWQSGIRSVHIMLILVDYLVPIQSHDGHEVAWLVQPAAWQLNLCPEIITTIPRETLAGAFDTSRAACLWIGAIHLIPEGTGVVPPPNVHLVVGFVKHLAHIWVEGSPLLPKRRTPVPPVRPPRLQLWKVVSRDWIKKEYIIKEVPGPLFLDAANIEYPYESTDMVRDESLYTVPIQWQALINNWCRHMCPSSCLPLFFVAALWCHCCELKINLHPKLLHYGTDEHSRRKPRGNVQSCVGYRVCFGTSGMVWFKSQDVERVQDAGSVCNTGGNENGGVCGKKGYTYSSPRDLIHILWFVGYWTQNGPAFILHNHRAPHEWEASRRDLLLAVRTICDTGHCFAITYHIYRSGLVHLGAYISKM